MLIAIPASIGKGLIMGVVEYYNMIADAMKKNHQTSERIYTAETSL